MRRRAAWLACVAVMVGACGGGDTGSATTATGSTGGPTSMSSSTTSTATTTTTPSAGNPVSWSTDFVTLEADDFVIVADGVEFYATGPLDIHSDTPTRVDDTDGTLEIEWMERGVEMRLYIYLERSSVAWNSSEIRTYDGNADGEWIYYTGPFFDTPLGESFRGNVVLKSDPEENEYSGEIRFTNLVGPAVARLGS
jgi:hypothetical protein